MTKLLFFIALICPVLALGAETKKKSVKLEFTYAPQFFQMSQKSEGEKVTGSGFIYKNMQFNARWKLDKVELDADYRYSNFTLETEDENLKTTMRDFSVGATYRNVFLRVENTIAPFISTSGTSPKALDLDSYWLTLGYRKIIFPNWRAGGGLSYLLSSDLEDFDVKSVSGYKGNAWIERWTEMKKLDLLLSLRLFGEARFMDIDSDYSTSSVDFQSLHFGIHAGIAKVF